MPPTGGGGNKGSLPRAPSVTAPKQCRTCSNKIRFAHISSVASLRDSFRCIFDWSQPTFLLRVLCCWRRLQITLTWLLRSLARAPYVVLFDLLKIATCRYICTVCMHDEEPQEPPEHTSEHVKSQNFLGACPQTPLVQSILRGSTFFFYYLPWAPPILSAAMLVRRIDIFWGLMLGKSWSPKPDLFRSASPIVTVSTICVVYC